MLKDVCIDMYIDMCIGMYIDKCTDMCMHMRIHIYMTRSNLDRTF